MSNAAYPEISPVRFAVRAFFMVHGVMKQEEITEIMACLPKGRTLFPYYRDRYAALLLAWAFPQPVTVAEVKQSRYAGLINKTVIRDAIARRGDGIIDHDMLAMIWADPCDQFLLTLGRWGGGERCWQQTSRAGFNLVLQVNLHDGYRRWFDKYVPQDERWLFNNYGHPVLREREGRFYRPTLGWVRLDIDLHTGEVLLEEVQSDWLRDLRTLQSWHSAKRAADQAADNACNSVDAEDAVVRAYCDIMLNRLGKIWSELLMAAALWFVREELGVRDVWFHTYDSGCELKRIKGDRPPKSLYTSLPRKFCYTATREPPRFLQRDKSFRRAVRGKPAPQWFHLQL
jgi:hypothetical protein